jgi:nucleoside-diphosphate-sugar epimerase
MMDRKKVVVIGSNGALANALIPKLIKQFEVTALIRSPSSFGLNSIFYREFNGDALSPEVWDEVLEGKDAVFFTYGPRSTDDPLSLVHLTRILIDKMKEKVPLFSYRGSADW